VVLVDGFVAGTWTADDTPAGTTIEVQPFAPLPQKVTRALAARAEGLPAELVPAPVTVRVAGVTA